MRRWVTICEMQENTHENPSVPRVLVALPAGSGFARRVMLGIASYCREHRPWRLHQINTMPVYVEPTIESWKPHGIIMHFSDLQRLHQLSELGVPLVSVTSNFDQPIVPTAMTDNVAIGKMIAEHFLARGLTHLAYYGQNIAAAEQRSQAYIQAAGQRASFTDVWLRNTRMQGVDWELLESDIAGWLRQLPKPVGVAAFSDHYAAELIIASQRSGFHVPDQISIISTGNDDLFCETSVPAISSVDPNTEKVGYEAANMLDQLMLGQSLTDPVRRIPPARISIRASSDRIVTDDPDLLAAARFIKDHACNGIHVEDVLNQILISRRALERRFREHFGCTPWEQIMRVRMEEVKRLLIETTLPLADISVRTGFKHATNLSAAFKRHTGGTPLAYRKANATR